MRAQRATGRQARRAAHALTLDAGTGEHLTGQFGQRVTAGPNGPRGAVGHAMCDGCMPDEPREGVPRALNYRSAGRGDVDAGNRTGQAVAQHGGSMPPSMSTGNTVGELVASLVEPRPGQAACSAGALGAALQRQARKLEL